MRPSPTFQQMRGFPYFLSPLASSRSKEHVRAGLVVVEGSFVGMTDGPDRWAGL